jgi:DNA-binding NarL/FixJ family response regulator
MTQGNRRHDAVNYHTLSSREREVMLLAAKGFANKQIARELKVTEGTVKIHLHRVYQKLGVKSRFALAVLAKELPSQPSGKQTNPSNAA